MPIKYSKFLFTKHWLTFPVHLVLFLLASYFFIPQFTQNLWLNLIFALLHTLTFILGFLMFKHWKDQKVFLQSYYIKRFPKIPFDFVLALVLPTLFAITYLLILEHPLFKLSTIVLNVLYLAICLVAYQWILITELNNNYLNTKLVLSEQEHYNTQLKKDVIHDMISPHFLFNSLNTLTGIVEESKGKAILFTSELVYLYDFILQNSKKSWILLEEELDLLKRYNYLLKSRFENTLIFDINVPEKYFNTYILPLTLQNLVENCVKHNVISKKRPLTIQIYIENDHIVVKNKMFPKKINKKKSTGFGLNYIQQQYQKRLNHNVVIEKEATYFVVKIPLKNSLKS